MLDCLALAWSVLAICHVILVHLESALAKSSIYKAVGLLFSILLVAVATTVIAHINIL